jgi:hypothetical protein
MKIPKVILVLTLSVLAVAFFVGCDNETTAPKRAHQVPVDPVDWDGDKENGTGSVVGESGQQPTQLGSAGSGFAVQERVLRGSLEPHDHTIIVETILSNVQEIAARLPQNQVSSGVDVLQAALMVPAVDRYTKSRIRLVLDALADLEQVQSRIPDDARHAVSDVLDRLEAYPTVTGKIEALQNMVDSGQYETVEGLPEGLVAGIEILRDGQKSIYAPRCFFNLKRMLQQDLAGAIAGAIAGGIVGGPPGAGLGALAGSAGASGSDAVGQLTGWW